ncbi:DMT family transporter [Paraglaciecola sp.]|uniref:DMT family transporter n=1 Tax=Paraglaciecola sp. TaxID=1920173 RepID=UPI003EF13984
MESAQSHPNKHWYGFALSLLTAFLWGVLPVFLKLCLETMNAPTITWYRFLVAGVFVLLVLYKRRSLPNIKALNVKTKWWVLFASLLLVANYVSNVQGLNYLAPETAQVLMQLAPFLLMLGGIVFFSERLTPLELLGAIFLLIGMSLFFNERIADLFSAFNEFTLGVVVIIFAAVTWAGYALMQKPLLKLLTAKQLTLCIYAIGVIVLLPFSQPSQLLDMQTIHWLALIFCCVNTIVGYGAFTEALSVWQASKVSAVITLAPIFTFLSMAIAVELLPRHFVSTDLNVWAYIGAGIVVVGSALTSLGKNNHKR